MQNRPRVAALVGPTGAGKTDLAIHLAERFRAEIVSADSRQVYRQLNIGSAKPSPEQRRAVPHHLVDVADLGETFDAARFRRLAESAIEAIAARGRRVLVVGGTGLYVKVLRGGLFAGPGRDPELRRRLLERERASPGWLFGRVREVDPETAARLHPRDHVRLVRALEVYERTGRPISCWRAEHGFRDRRFGFRTIALSLPRAELYRRIEARCRAMVASGLLDEVRSILAAGYSPELPPLRSPGYREMIDFLAGNCDLPAALDRMARATRRLAKRQLTWFRGDPEAVWLPPDAARIARELEAFWTAEEPAEAAGSSASAL